MKHKMMRVLPMLIVACSSHAAMAQEHPIVDAKGFQLNRDYFSQFPFEHIDMATGSLMLTFTDLVLPGHQGRDLRFQRTFNSKTERWTFGLAGYALYVHEPGMPTMAANSEDFSPTFYTADGGEHRSKSTKVVNFSSPSAIEQSYDWVTTERFWRYWRGTAQDLYMPDGTHCHYENDGASSTLKRLEWCDSPYGTRELSIDWDGSEEESGVIITQHFTGHQRSVVLKQIEGAAAQRLPQQMTFMGKTWFYDWSGPVKATPPDGPPWEFTFTQQPNLRTLIVKTPTAGRWGSNWRTSSSASIARRKPGCTRWL